MVRSVVISGASTGIGKASALYLDSRGFRVFAGVRKSSDGDRLRAQASERLSVIFLDVSDEASIENARNTVSEALGGEALHGLVNNAGISISGPLEFVPFEDVRLQFDVNVFGPLTLTRAFLPHLRRARGRIVNLSSISGRVASPFLGPYAMSKFALEAFTDVLRRELAPWGIEVSAIEPGAIRTPIWEKSIATAKTRIDAMPPKAHELYGPAMARLGAIAEKMGDEAPPPDGVARAVHHALTARRPKTRYLVGRDAKLQALFSRSLPDRWLDRLFRKFLKLD